jgi:MCP family monocarboxylic acid transporter-like MFS transporter 10
VYFDNWKNKKYVIWALAVPSALFGYFVPYFHLVAYVKSINEARFNNTINGNITIGDIDSGPVTAGVDDAIEEDSGFSGEFLVTCMAATSLVGRIVFGKIADHSKVNPVFLQQISFVSTGICTMLLTASPLLGVAAYPSMVILSLLLGLFDGCFITMFGPIAYGICGPSGASQGIGFILGMCGIPLCIGPPIAGKHLHFVLIYVSFVKKTHFTD